MPSVSIKLAALRLIFGALTEWATLPQSSVYRRRCLGKTINASFLTGTSCGWEDKQRFMFRYGIYKRKKIKKKATKLSRHGTAGISKSGSGSTFNIYDVSSRVYRH